MENFPAVLALYSFTPLSLSLSLSPLLLPFRLVFLSPVEIRDLYSEIYDTSKQSVRLLPPTLNGFAPIRRIDVLYNWIHYTPSNELTINVGYIYIYRDAWQTDLPDIYTTFELSRPVLVSLWHRRCFGHVWNEGRYTMCTLWYFCCIDFHVSQSMVKREYIIYLFDRFNRNGSMTTTNVYLYRFMYRDVTSDTVVIILKVIIIFVIRNFDEFVFEINSFFFF